MPLPLLLLSGLFANNIMRGRRRHEQESRLAEREATRRDYEAGLAGQAEQRASRAQTISDAMKMLVAGNKEAAGTMLEGAGIPVRSEVPPEGAMYASKGGFNLETAAEAGERELGGKLREARGKAEIERQTVQETDPAAYSVGLIAKKARGEKLTDDEEQGLKSASQLFLAARGRDKTARDLFDEDLFAAMREGRELNPVQSEYLNRTVLKNEPKTEEERITRRVATEGLESLTPGERHIWDNFITPKAESKYLRQIIDLQGLDIRRRQAEDLERERQRRNEDRDLTRRDVELDRVRQAIKDVTFRHERRRDRVPTGSKRQQGLAEIDADEQAEVEAVVTRAKKQYPHLSADLDAFLTQPRKKQPLIQLFKEALQ